MHDLYNLKETLMRELESYGHKDKLDISTLQTIDTLAHSLKNVCKVIQDCEAEQNGYSMARGGGYSQAYAMMPPMYGQSYENSYAGNSYANGNSYDMSFARGRGPNAARDSMGRYSSADGDIRMQMQQLMQQAPNDIVRQKMAEAMNAM